MGTIASLAINITGNISGLQSAMSSAVKTVQSASKSMIDTGKSMTLAVTAPLVGIGGAALAAGTQLNEGMANVASLGVAADRVTELKNNVQDMAITTGKSTTDLVGGLYQVVSAFGDTAATSQILETNAKAAAAGLATTTDSINLTSAVTKAYGDTSAEAVQKAADLALQTVKLGQTTFPELAASLGSVTPMAQALGVSQEELFASMATLTGVTGNASAVTTQLRATYQAVLKPTEDMKASITAVASQLDQQGKLVSNQFTTAWKSAGAELMTATNTVSSLTKQLEATNTTTEAGKKKAAELKAQLKEATKAQGDARDAYKSAAGALGQSLVQSVGASEAIRLLTQTADGNTDTLGKMFGSVEALNAVLALSGAQAGDYTNKLAEMQKASGATDAAFNAQTQGVNKLGFMMQQAKAKMEVFLQKLSDGMAPLLLMIATLLEPVGDKLLELANYFTQLSPATQMWITGIALAVAAIGPMLVVVGKLTGLVASAMPVLSAIGGAIAAISWPIWLIIGAVAVLSAAWIGNWFGIRDAVMSVWSALQNYVVMVQDAGFGSIEAGEAISLFPGWLQSAVTAFDGFMATLGLVGEYLKLVVSDGDYLNDFLADIPAWMQPAVEWLGRLVAGTSELLGGSDFAQLKSDVTTAFGDVWQAVKSFFSGDISFDGLASALYEGFGRIKDSLASFFGGGDFSKFLGTIQWDEFIEKLSWENIVTKLDSWATYINTLVWDTVIPTLSSWGDYITSLPWGDYITAFTDWGSYIVNLPWGDYITNLSDWASYITSIDWSQYVPSQVEWADILPVPVWNAYVTALDWLTIIKAIDWPTFVAVMSSWATYISNLPWGTYVATLASWGTYITNIAWGTFLPVLSSWGSYITSLPWGSYVAALTSWATYISVLSWSVFVATMTNWGTYITSLPWGTYIATLSSWGTYITSLAWSSMLPILSSWGTYIANLDWLGFVVKLVDWATWIPALGWATFITLLAWTAFVGYLALSSFVSMLTWSNFVAALTWAAWLVKLTWTTFITAVSWTFWITALAWTSFIDKVKWLDYVTKMSAWSSFIPPLTWSSFVDKVDLASYIPDFGSWYDYIKAYFSGADDAAGAGGNALGTNRWAGGMTWVGETGPELVRLPRGSQIFDNRTSEAMAGGGGNVTVVIDSPQILNGINMRELAYIVADEIQRARR